MMWVALNFSSSDGSRLKVYIRNRFVVDFKQFLVKEQRPDEVAVGEYDGRGFNRDSLCGFHSSSLM